MYVIFDRDGVWKDSPGDVTQAFLEYYQQLLGITSINRKKVVPQIVHSGPVVNTEQQASLAREYTIEEKTQALFSILGDKAPETDGYGAHFYKDAWGIVGPYYVIEVVLDFFRSDRLLKEVNNTTNTLIPKSKCPNNVV